MATTFDFAEDAYAGINYLKTHPDVDPVRIGIIGNSEGALIAPELDEQMLNMLKWTWFKTFLSLDPDRYLSKVSTPALAITGEKDIQCPPEENLTAIDASLKRAGNTNYTVKVMPQLNHLFQTAESGSPYEYEQIAEIISPDALEFILAWLKEVNP